MKRRKYGCVCLAALALGIAALTGCGRGGEAAPTEPVAYSSSVEQAACALCGEGADGPFAALWGTEGLALVSVNTFALETLDIGVAASPDSRTHFFAGGVDGVYGVVDDYAKRGLAFGSLSLKQDAAYAPEQMAAYLCADCLEAIASPGACAVGVVNFKTRELRLFQARNSGFTLGDFYVAYTLEQGNLRFLAVHCPPRD